MEAFTAMAAGDPVDQQRDQRWPNRTADAQPRVQFHDWEEESDVSDMEGIFGFPRGSTQHMIPREDEDAGAGENDVQNGGGGGAKTGESDSD